MNDNKCEHCDDKKWLSYYCKFGYDKVKDKHDKNNYDEDVCQKDNYKGLNALNANGSKGFCDYDII